MLPRVSGEILSLLWSFPHRLSPSPKHVPYSLHRIWSHPPKKANAISLTHTQIRTRTHNIRMAIRICIQIQIVLLTFEGERGGQRRGLTRISIRSLVRIRHGGCIVWNRLGNQFGAPMNRFLRSRGRLRLRLRLRLRRFHDEARPILIASRVWIRVLALFRSLRVGLGLDGLGRVHVVPMRVLECSRWRVRRRVGCPILSE